MKKMKNAPPYDSTNNERVIILSKRKHSFVSNIQNLDSKCQNIQKSKKVIFIVKNIMLWIASICFIICAFNINTVCDTVY